jgi:hypothetical protein
VPALCTEIIGKIHRKESSEGIIVSIHPLIALSNDRRVKQAKEFKVAAAEIDGAALEAHYNVEISNAPKRHDQNKKHLSVRTSRIPSGPQNGKDDKHLAMALTSALAAGAEQPDITDLGTLQIVDSLVPLRTAAPDKARGDADPNKGVEDIDLLALLPDDRVAVVCLKYLSPNANRGGAGDTPLRALLRGLSQVAMVDANQAAFREEILAATGRTTNNEAPALIIAAAPKYWQLCRKREAQKGAAWIREMERLGRESSEQIGVEVFYLALDLDGDPPWEYGEEGPLLNTTLGFDPAWEPGAGKLSPRSKSKKKSSPADLIVDGNMDKDPIVYSLNGSFESGDRIEHKSLGAGVVQGTQGQGKIRVLFGEDMKILIHERPSAGA